MRKSFWVWLRRARQVPEGGSGGRFCREGRKTPKGRNGIRVAVNRKNPIGRSDIATRRSTMLLFAVRMLGQFRRCDQRCMVDLGRLNLRTHPVIQELLGRRVDHPVLLSGDFSAPRSIAILMCATGMKGAGHGGTPDPHGGISTSMTRKAPGPNGTCLAEPKTRYSHKVYYGMFLYTDIPDSYN